MRQNKNFRYFINIILLCAIIISLLGFYRDYKNTVIYGGVDLRNRVVGARLLLNKEDPYFYKWQEGDSELFLQLTDNINSPLSYIMVPPTVLTFYTTIAPLHYKAQRFIWFLAQWSLLIVSITLLAKSSHDWLKSRVIWIFGLIFVSGASFWRLHVERGQVYILFIFLISLAYWLYSKKFKLNEILSGVIIGITISFRPSYILMGLPMLIFKRFKILLGTLCGLIISVGTSFIYANLSTWKNYFLATNIYSKLYLKEVSVSGNETISSRTVEGLDNLDVMAIIPASDSSIANVLRENLNIGLYRIQLIFLLITIIIIATIVIIVLRRNNNNLSFIFLLGLILVLLSDFFLPAPKFSYGNLIWLPIIALLINYSEPVKRLLNPFLILLFLGLFFSISIPFAPRDMLLPDILVPFYLIFNTLLFMIQNRNLDLEKEKVFK